MRLVYIKWIDSWTRKAGWKPIEEFKSSPESCCYCESIGWVISKTKKNITLVSSLCGRYEPNEEVQSVDGDITIPLVAAIKLKYLPHPYKIYAKTKKQPK